MRGRGDEEGKLTSLRVAFVDVYVLRGRADTLEALLLRRARGRARGGSWEGVHGKIEPGEKPVAAALRELFEETACRPLALYNLSRVEHFYLHQSDETVMIPAFVAFVALDAVIHLGDEHDMSLWLTLPGAAERCSWPRASRALEDAVRLLGQGSAGLLEDTLRVG
ncbi:MAG: NUDIX domain-containing protein [Gemmatimonadales bacterium]